MRELNTPKQLNELEAWSLVEKAIRNSIYNSQEEFSKLPPLVQKAVGSPNVLDALLGIGSWIVDNVFKPILDGFKNAFGIHSPSTVMQEQGHMNKKQQTLNPEAAVEMVIKMQDRQTNAIEILSGLILQFEQINYVLHKIDEATCETGKGVDDAWNMLKNREGIWQGANIVQTYMSSFEKNIADVIELIDTEDITGYIPAEKTDRA